MRILYLTHRLPYAPNRGDRIRAYHMLRHLAPRHAVHLVSLVHDAEEASHAPELRDVAASVATAPVTVWRKTRRGIAALATGTPMTHALLDAAALKASIERVVANGRPDLVIAYCSGMARLALESPLAGVPFVLDMVDVDSEKWAALGRGGLSPRTYIYRREAIYLRAFERAAANAAGATLVVNERERRSLLEMGVAGRVEVVANGIALDAFAPPGGPSAEPRVVFCGVMNYEPNEQAALWLAREVWPEIRRARPDARLLLLGAHPTRRVRDLAASDATIEVTGSVPEVPPHLWRSAVSVAPLLVARGLQNKVLEATAAGLPSVVSPAVFDGLPPEVASACVRAETADEYASRILGLLSLTPDARRRIAREARLDTLGWSHRLAKLDAILAAAASRSQRRSA